MLTNECTKNDGIRKIPFGTAEYNNSAKKHQWVLKSQLKFDKKWGNCIILS